MITILYFSLRVHHFLQGMKEKMYLYIHSTRSSFWGSTRADNKDTVDNYTFVYLLSVDDTRYFLARKSGQLLKGQYIGEMAELRRA